MSELRTNRISPRDGLPDGETCIRISADGNIGIGTDNPRSKLDINGTDSELRFYRDAGDRFGGLRYTGTKLTLKLPDSDNFVVDDTNDIERFRVQSNGNVGIGSTDPGTNLDIAGNIRLSADDAQIQLNDGGPRLRVPIANTLTIHTGGSLGTDDYERLRIDVSGNIGIGTTNPQTSLDLSQKSDGIALPQGTTAQRPTGNNPYIRWNTSNSALEVYNGSNWIEIVSEYFPEGSGIFG